MFSALAVPQFGFYKVMALWVHRIIQVIHGQGLMRSSNLWHHLPFSLSASSD